jgi:hypothetical protein
MQFKESCMSVSYKLKAGLAALSAVAVVAHAEPVTDEINFQGFSGLFNVPSGSTIEYGEFHFYYSNLNDTFLSQRGSNPSYFQGHQFNIAASPFPGLEVSMRNTSKEESLAAGSSDLTANFKYSPTFIPKEWFEVSIGYLDLGGETGTQRAAFGAISKDWGDFRFTVGSGKQGQEISERRWESGFYGVEYQPYEWFTAVAEHDGVNTNYGVKLRTPKRWLGGTTQIYADWMVGSDINEDQTDEDAYYIGVGIRATLFSSFDAALDRPKRLERRIADNLDWLFADYEDAYVEPNKGLSSLGVEDDKIVEQLGRLKRALAIQGFEEIWIGLREGRLYLRFENSVFNRNDVDALGVAMGLVASFSGDNITMLDVNLSKYGIPLLRFETDAKQLKEFYNHEAALPKLTPLKATSEQTGDMFWVGGSRSPYFVPRVSLSPQVANFTGTELGMIDYSAAIRAAFEVPVWPGAVFHANYDTNLNDTTDFEKGRTFYRWRIPTRWSSYTLKQTVKLPFDIYASVGIGRWYDTYLQDYDGVTAEGLWQSPKGAHQFSFTTGAFENIYYPTLKREIAVGRYRFYYDDFDVSLMVEAGQYFRQDRGGKAELAFNFGDTQVRFFALDTDYKAVGLGFTVPIGLRRDMRPRLFQLKGADQWKYGISTTVARDDGTNGLAPGRVKLLPYMNEIRNQYFNGDRLSVSYISVNAERLKDAYFNLTRQ